MNQWEHDEARVHPAPVATIVATSAAAAVSAEPIAPVVAPSGQPPKPTLVEKIESELKHLEEEVKAAL